MATQNGATALRRWVAWCLMMIALGIDTAAAQDCEPAVSSRAQQDVRTLVQAVYGGDADTVLRYTHAKVVQLHGGRTAARETIQKVIDAAKAANMTIESLTFPAAPTCLTAGGRRFIIVPTLSVIASGGQRVESLNYQFGVTEPGASTSTYVEGSRVNTKTVQLLFPGFPKDYTFPAIYRKPL